jgi:hypothetical protein
VEDSQAPSCGKKRLLGWLWPSIGLALLLLFVCFFLYMHDAYMAAMFPPPSKEGFTRMQKQIDDAGIPLKADTLIGIEMDRPSYVGEGDLLITWTDLTQKFELILVDGQPDSFIIRSKNGRFTKLKKLTSKRVRIYTGGYEEGEANQVFRTEMNSGEGRHPVYKLSGKG